MIWRYEQKTGILSDPNGEMVACGYSGNGEGLNNPEMQAVKDHGPIPRGSWVVGSFFDDPGGKGPVVAHLTPVAGTETFGRSGFMIHGDNEAMNHTASEGCIVLPRSARERIAQSGDAVLDVVE